MGCPSECGRRSAKQFTHKTKGNPIDVAEDQLPAKLKGKLPTAKQLADAVKGEMGRMNYHGLKTCRQSGRSAT